MHEMSIMASILDIVKKTAQQEGAAKVTRIELTIGERSGVMKDALTFAFEAMSPKSMAAGAVFVVTEIPLLYRCPSCATESNETLNLCPGCDCFFEVVRGQELQITSIEVE